MTKELVLCFLWTVTSVYALNLGKGDLCGYRADDMDDEFRIIGGQTAKKRHWPWMVEIDSWEKDHWKQHCGGTLIYPNWVITARHCIAPFIDRSLNGTDMFRKLQVRLGVHDKTNDLDPDIQTFNLTLGLDLPATYGKQMSDRDITLLRLDAPIQLDERLAAFPACMPKTSSKFIDQTTPHQQWTCFVLGWGINNVTAGTTARELQQLGVRIREEDDCNQQKKIHRKTYKFKRRKHFCAATPVGPAAGSCQGDSGGPLVCWADGDVRWRIVAVYSRGYNKCSSHGIYMKISRRVKQWIIKTVKQYENQPAQNADLNVQYCHSKKGNCQSWKWMERYRELDEHYTG